MIVARDGSSQWLIACLAKAYPILQLNVALLVLIEFIRRGTFAAETVNPESWLALGFASVGAILATGMLQRSRWAWVMQGLIVASAGPAFVIALLYSRGPVSFGITSLLFIWLLWREVKLGVDIARFGKRFCARQPANP